MRGPPSPAFYRALSRLARKWMNERGGIFPEPRYTVFPTGITTALDALVDACPDVTFALSRRRETGLWRVTIHPSGAHPAFIEHRDPVVALGRAAIDWIEAQDETHAP